VHYAIALHTSLLELPLVQFSIVRKFVRNCYNGRCSCINFDVNHGIACVARDHSNINRFIIDGLEDCYFILSHISLRTAVLWSDAAPPKAKIVLQHRVIIVCCLTQASVAMAAAMTALQCPLIHLITCRQIIIYAVSTDFGPAVAKPQHYSF